MAPPLAQSSPPGEEDQGRRESERRERGRNRDEPEALSPEGESCQRAELELERACHLKLEFDSIASIAYRAEVDLSLTSRADSTDKLQLGSR